MTQQEQRPTLIIPNGFSQQESVQKSEFIQILKTISTMLHWRIVTRNPRTTESINAVAKEEGIDLSRSVAIVRSRYGIPLLLRVGYPICLNPDSELRIKAEQCKWPIILDANGELYFLRGKEVTGCDTGLPNDIQDAFRAQYAPG